MDHKCHEIIDWDDPVPEGECDCMLDHCLICGLVESELTDDCPGVPVPKWASDECHMGRLNFRDGAWRKEPTPFFTQK